MVSLTHARRTVEADTDRTGNGRLARSVRTKDHVQVRTRAEFHKVIGDKVLDLNSYNRSRDITAKRSVNMVHSSQKKCRLTHPCRVAIEAV